MRLRTPREVNDKLRFFGIPPMAVIGWLVGLPILYLTFDMPGLLLSFVIIGVGAAIAKLPRGYFIHLAYSKGLVPFFYDGSPHGPVKSYRE